MKTHTVLFLATLVLVLAGCSGSDSGSDTEETSPSTYEGNLEIEQLPEGAAEALKIEDAVFVYVFDARGKAILYQASDVERREIELPETVSALRSADTVMKREAQSTLEADRITNLNSFSVLSYEGSFCVTSTTSAGYAVVTCLPSR